jgi:peptidyl-prolyl cis-trans isomerase SurA
MARNYQRIYRSLSAVAILLSLSLSINAKELINKIAVIVNDGIIVESEITHQLELVKKRYLANNQINFDAKAMRKQIIDDLILHTIKLQMAKERGLQATVSHVDNLLIALARQNNITLAQLKEVINKEQGSYLQFRKNIGNDYIINQLEQSIIHSRIQINDQDIKEEVKVIEKLQNKNSKYHLLHFVLTSKSQTKENLIAQANKTRALLLKGQELSLIQSQLNTQTNIQNKDLGLLSPESLPNIFINAIEGLSKGDVSQPIKTENGVHLLQVLNKEGATRIIIPEMKARHILLIANKLRSEKETLVQIKKIRQQLQTGNNFALLAKKYSEDPGSAINGGDLGWFGSGKMVKAFENQLIKLQIDEISEPFKSQFGWHIVQLQGKRKTDITDAKIQEQAKKNLVAQKVKTDTKRWEKRIKQEAYIEYR